MSGDKSSDGVYRLESDAIRRTFLRTLAASGTGLVGIKSATQDAFGEEPDGVPIVWRRDRFGNPETINYVPKERRRRIKVYENLRWETFHGRSDKVTGVTLRQQSASSTDLALQVNLDQDKWSVRRELPSRVQGTPVVFDEKEINTEPVVCDRRHKNFYDPLPANPEINAYNSNDDFVGKGTIGVVGWNDDANSPYKCYLTAAHVVNENGTPAEHMRHGGDDDGQLRQEYVGDIDTMSPLTSNGMDVAKYRRNSGTVSADLRGNADSHIGDLAGTWTHSGLTDATTGSESVPAEFAGAQNCYKTCDCIETYRMQTVDYEAEFEPIQLDKGDSGGPFVDNDDFLMALVATACIDNCDSAGGGTGQELLDRVGAQLFDPRIS